MFRLHIHIFYLHMQNLVQILLVENHWVRLAIEQGQELDDKHMDAVSQLLRKSHGHISGLNHPMASELILFSVLTA